MKTIYKKNYPALLKQIHNPPPQLYCRGNTKLLHTTCLSIVGTRKSTEYGGYCVTKILRELSNYDLTIVSGLAIGIDTLAHHAALEFDLPTIAVLGTGIENIYPPQNLPLAKKILDQEGLIVSEYPERTAGIPHQFPARNRIISGLSIATLVVEAPDKSGALITARFALEQNREVFVVPGDIERCNSQGCIELLQKGGAYPVRSGKDIIDYLKLQPSLFAPDAPTGAPLTPNLSPQETQVLNCIPKTRRRTFSEVANQLDLSINLLLSILTNLEINGFIDQKAGKYLRKI